MQIRTTQNVGIDFTPASVMHRTIGGILDALVMIMLAVGASLLATWLIGILGSTSVLLFFTVYGGVLLYPVICESLFSGRTLGKMAMRTRVVRIDGRRATLGAFFIRWLIGLFEIFGTMGALGFVLVVATKKHQRIGDMAAGTTVVVEPKPVTLDALMMSVRTTDTVLYPAAQFLTEDEAETIRQVILSARSGIDAGKALDLMWASAEALQPRMGENSITDPWVFLTQVLESYHASQSNPAIKA